MSGKKQTSTRATAALNQREKWFRAAEETSLDAFTILDAVRDESGAIVDFRWTYVNPEAGRILKHPPDYLVGRRLLEVLPGNQQRSDLFERYVRVVESGEPHDYELRYESEGIQGWFRNMTVKLGDGVAIRFADITERKEREARLETLNRTLKALGSSGKAMMRATDEPSYLRDVCQVIVKDCGHAMVWIGYAEQDPAKTVRPVAYSGFEEGYLETLKVTWADTERGRGPTGTAIRTGKPSACRNMLTDPKFAPWREEATRRGYASSLVLPLVEAGAAFGAISIYSREPDSFSEDEVNLLTELADDVAYGITAIRTRAARERAERALKEHVRNVETLSRSATRLIEPMPSNELFKYAAERVRAVAGRAVVSVSEQPPGSNQVIARALLGPRDRMAKVQALIEQNLVGKVFDVPDGTRERMQGGKLALVEGGLYDLTFGQLPQDLCRRLEEELDLGDVYAMPFILDQDFLGTVAVMTDRTEGLKNRGTVEALVSQIGLTLKRRQAEEALQEAKDDLEERVLERTAQLRRLALELTHVEQRERKRLAGILHDHLQQLLVGARMGVQLLQRQVGDKNVGQSVENVSNLLNESIKVSKSLTVELSPPILHEAGLAAAVNWLGRWMSENHGLTVEVDAKTEIEADKEGVCILLFESIRELLFNVVKHTQVKAAKVSIAETEAGEVRIVVADRGAGFDPERIGGEGAAARFGLFSIRERLGLVGGHADIDSAPGLGTRVTLVAPMPKPQEPDRVELVRRASRTAAEQPAAGSVSKIRVLVADDHKIVRQGLTELLREEADIEVVGEASDGVEAVEMAARLRPDVIVMDISMPRLNGIEATRRITAAQPRVRVIGLSMYEEPERAAAMREAGAVAYLHKAGPSEDLIAAIHATR